MTMLQLSSPELLALLAGTGAEQLLRRVVSADPSAVELLRLSVHRQNLDDLVAELQAGTVFQAALAAGVHDILDQFYEAIGNTEAELLDDPTLVPQQIRHRLRAFATVLPLLDALVGDVLRRQLCGGQLLSLLHRQSQSGDATIATAFTALLLRVHQPFFAHLIRWMAYSELDAGTDSVDFFVRRVSSCAPEQRALGRPWRHEGVDVSDASEQPRAIVIASNVIGGVPRRAGAEPVEPQLQVLASSPPAASHMHGSAHHQSAVATDADSARLLDRHLREYEWTKGYTIAYDAVPSAYFPDELAETVLAIGKAVLVLKHHSSGVDGGAASASAVRHTGTGARGAEHTGAVEPMDSLGDGHTSRSNDAGSMVFTREDSLALAHLLHSLRSAPQFSLLVTQTVIHKVRDAVYERLWKLLIHDALVIQHVSSVRSYLLLGRGDFYQAFLEHSKRFMNSTAATSPGVVAALRSGPWEAAAAQVGLRSEAHALSSSHSGVGALDGAGVGGAADPAFDRLSLSLGHRAVRFECTPARTASDGGASVGGIEDFARDANGSVLGNSRAAQQAQVAPLLSASNVFKFWKPCVAPGSDRLLKLQRVPAKLLLLGTAGVMTVSASTTAPSVPAGGTAAGAASASHIADKLCLAVPTALPPPGLLLPHPSGAVWMFQPMPVTKGFLLRLSISIPVPDAGAQSQQGGAAAPGSETMSFAVVLHRDHALALGASSSPATSPSGQGAGGGFGSIQNSIAIHVLCKRLSSAATSETPSPMSPHAEPSYRVVAAVYGPPGRSPSSPSPASLSSTSDRVLLASGAIMETQLPSEQSMSYHYPGPTASAMGLKRLNLSIEYVAPGSASNASGSSSAMHSPSDAAAAVLQRAAGSGKGRLRVCMLDASAIARAAADRSRRSSTATNRSTVGDTATGAAAGAVTAPIIDAAFTMEEVINFAGTHGPGRGRAWVGLTAESARLPAASTQTSRPAAAPAATVSQMVWLDGLDFVSYSDADEGYAGLCPSYAVPWPAQLLLHHGAMAVYEDVFKLGFKAKAVALGLQHVWRTLMDANISNRANGGSGSNVAASIASGGVSAQSSGIAGKRTAAQLERAGWKLAMHDLLRPVWLLRAKMQFVVDALLYHLQVDVIESAHADFELAASEARDYGALQAAHDAFLRRLLEGSFLQQSSLAACIQRLLNHAERLVALVSSHSKDLSMIVSSTFAAAGSAPAGSAVLSELSEAFASDVRYLEMAASDRTSLHGADATSFLMRLDFNGFFSQT